MPKKLSIAVLTFFGLAPGLPLFAVRPNILFVFSDDHAYQSIGVYGSKIHETPQFDRLASQGMRFDRCLVTNSICGPSRATILTGKYSHRNGFYGNRDSFDAGQRTFPLLLQESGYRTALFGKWHLRSRPRGFDEWRILYGQGKYYRPDMRTAEGRVASVGYVTDHVTDLALEWLEKGRDSSKPFLLMVQHKGVHRSWEPDVRHLNLYESVDVPEPSTLFDDYTGRASPARNQKMRIAEHLRYEVDLKMRRDLAASLSNQNGSYGRLTEEERAVWDAAYQPANEAFLAATPQGDALVRWKYQRYIKDYLRCVASLDDNLGRVLDYLETSDQASNTVVIYSSDQGFFLGEHGWFDKRWMYEESLRTPLLVRWPGVVSPDSVNRDIVSNLDFAGTFLELAGVSAPEDLQGRSLVPLLRGETPADWRRSFYYHYYEDMGHGVPKHYGVATERYKLIHFYGLDEWELFDREQDPHELKSVFGRPEYAAVEDELREELTKLREEFGVYDQAPRVHYLWRGQGAPGALGGEDRDKPRLLVYLPEGATVPSGRETPAVVICPGGGYGGLALRHEGHAVARWLNSIGVAAMILRYRLPGEGYRHPFPLRDAQRALRLVRSRASDWNVDPQRVGLMGFSAGGHLASTVATHHDAGNPEAADPVDRVSCRPDFAVLGYPVITMTGDANQGSKRNLLGPAPDPTLERELSNDLHVTRDTPPTFLVHASDDTTVQAEQSIRFYLALRKAGVPAELHIYEKGGHGFGVGGRPRRKPTRAATTWFHRCAEWFRTRGIVGP